MSENLVRWLDPATHQAYWVKEPKSHVEAMRLVAHVPEPDRSDLALAYLEGLFLYGTVRDGVWYMGQRAIELIYGI